MPFDIAKLSPLEQAEVAEILWAEERAEMEGSFEAFVKAAWHVMEPTTTLVWNWHMTVLCGYLQALFERKLRVPRLIINIIPGSSKSLCASVFWPAWIWAKEPGLRFLTSSNDKTLVMRDNVNMRTLVASDWFQGYWGEKVVPDTGQWGKDFYKNMALGFRQGVTMKGSHTGKRGDIQIIDDPHDAKKAFFDNEIQAGTDGWDQGMVTRVNNMEHSRRLLIMQRLRTNDLTGHLLSNKQMEWVHLIIPFEYTGEQQYDPVKDIGPEYAHLADPRRKAGELLDPIRFPASIVPGLKNTLGEYGWAGQMQQNPVPMGGGIIKKKWWRRWESMHGWCDKNPTRKRPPPLFKHVFWSWDTAFTTLDRKNNAFTAGTKWGLFFDDHDETDKLMLLDEWHGRVPYHALRKRVLEASKSDTDAHLIERKASGISLIQDLRRNKNIKVRSYDPRGDGDKEARAMLCTAHFERGMIVYPDREWANQVIDWVTTFPSGAPPSADITDTCLVPETLIYCADGVRPLSSVQVGDLVLTHRGRFRRVLQTMARESDHVHALKAGGLPEILITGNHPVLVETGMDREFIPAAEVKARPRYEFKRNGKVVNSVKKASGPLPRMVIPSIGGYCVSSLKLTDFGSWDQASSTHIFDPHPLSRPVRNQFDLTYEAGWLFGLFVAEGCMAYGKHGPRTVHLSCDKWAIDRADALFRKIFDVNVSRSICKRTGVHRASVSRKPLALLFAGFGRRSENLRLPQWLFDAPAAFCEGFLRGYSYGDGYEHTSKHGTTRQIAETASVALAHQVRLLLAKLNIPCSLNKSKCERFVEINKGKLSKCLPTWKVVWTWCPVGTQIGVKTPSGIGHWIERNQRIDGRFQVMNLSVEEDESYVTVGGAVHNCSQAIIYVTRQQWIRHPDDAIKDQIEEEMDEDDYAPPRRHGTYG